MNPFKKQPDKKQNQTLPPAQPPPQKNPAPDPNVIEVFDAYGRELQIPRQHWKDKELPGNLELVRNNPGQLYAWLIGALKDGFAADVIPYAEHLARIEPTSSRGAILLGITYMEVNRVDDAQRVLEDHIAAHGEDGVVLNNLAKIYDRRGDKLRAESTLWHALEVDPNQDNGFYWYISIQNERGGPSAALEAYRRVARLPRSWRAQLWLARGALEENDLPAAQALYAEALARAERPVPTDLLMQMSSDLGQHGHLEDIIRLVEPHFDSGLHGLLVGNNLIKANLDLGRPDAARQVLNQLYAQKRSDWQERLDFWEREIAKADVAKQPASPAEQVQVVLVTFRGPLWMRDRSPFAALLPAKRADAPQVAILGSTALVEQAPQDPTLQLSDGPGRLSRAIPLALAERIHLATDAVGMAFIPWAQGKGLVLLGHPYEDRALCDMAGKGNSQAAHMIGITVDTTASPWKIDARVLRKVDARLIAAVQVQAAPDNPGPAVQELADKLLGLLVERGIVRPSAVPSWYSIPSSHSSAYLVRLEQQLAMMCMQSGSLKGGGLFGEHEIMNGTLRLCVDQPENPVVRMLLAQSLQLLQNARPEIVREYKDKIALLQRDHPLAGDVGKLANDAIADVLERS